MSKRSESSCLPPKRIAISAEDIRKASELRHRRAESEKARIDDFLDDDSDPDDDETCHVPDDQVPDVLRPPTRRRNAEPDEFGFHPIIRDAEQGAAVDEYMEKNWAPGQFRCIMTELSRQGANNMAIVNWMQFETQQRRRLLLLASEQRLSPAEMTERRKLVAWFRSRTSALLMAPTSLQRYVAEFE